MKLFEELKRRNVFRVGIAYLAIAWAYELTPDGIKAEKDIDRSEPGSTVTGPWVSRFG